MSGRRKRGWWTNQKGDRNAHAYLNRDQVLEIRRLAAEGVRQCDIAAKIGTSRRNVYMIVTRRSWAELQP